MKYLPKKQNKKVYLDLYILTLPVLVLLLAVLAGVGLTSYKMTSIAQDASAGSVLSSEDRSDSSGSGSSDSESSEDSTDSEDNDEDKSAEEASKKAEEASKKAAERARETAKKQQEILKKQAELTSQNRTQSSGGTSVSPLKMDDDTELEHENENELDSLDDMDLNDDIFDLESFDLGISPAVSSLAKGKSEKLIVNPDGTTSRVKVEFEDGKMKLEVKNFDASGNTLGEYKFKTEDGKEIELEGESVDGKSKLKYDAEHQLLRVKLANLDVSGSSTLPTEMENEFEDVTELELEDEDTLDISIQGNQFNLARKGANALSNFPIKIDQATGVVYVSTPNGPVELKQMPDVIVQKAQDDSELESVTDVSLASTDTNDLTYVVKGVKGANLFGVLPIELSDTLVYDAQTGELKFDQKTFLTKLLGWLSF